MPLALNNYKSSMLSVSALSLEESLCGNLAIKSTRPVDNDNIIVLDQEGANLKKMLSDDLTRSLYFVRRAQQGEPQRVARHDAYEHSLIEPLEILHHVRQRVLVAQPEIAR